MTDLAIAYLLAILILIAGVSWMFGGKSWATKVVQWPLRFAGRQAKALLTWGWNQLWRLLKAPIPGTSRKRRRTRRHP